MVFFWFLFYKGRFFASLSAWKMLLKFWAVLLKQAPLRDEPINVRRDNRRILMFAICHPNFDNTEILFGWDSDTGYTIHKVSIAADTFPN